MNVVIVPAGVAVGLDTDSFSPFHGARVASWGAPYLDVAEPSVFLRKPGQYCPRMVAMLADNEAFFRVEFHAKILFKEGGHGS